MDNKIEKNVEDILESVNFIKDNAASKKDLEKFPTKDDLKSVEDKVDRFEEKVDNLPTKDDYSTLVSTVDALIKRYDMNLQETTSMKARMDRLENMVNKIANKVDIELTT